MDLLKDFSTFSFNHQERERTVYRKGEGPAVLIMHEVPGISVEVARFARRVVDAGFTVFMPRMFGPVGVKTSPLNRVPELLKLCVNREFHVLAENRSSPIADWLRALARQIHEEMGGRGRAIIWPPPAFPQRHPISRAAFFSKGRTGMTLASETHWRLT